MPIISSASITNTNTSTCFKKEDYYFSASWVEDSLVLHAYMQQWHNFADLQKNWTKKYNIGTMIDNTLLVFF